MVVTDGLAAFKVVVVVGLVTGAGAAGLVLLTEGEITAEFVFEAAAEEAGGLTVPVEFGFEEE